MSTTPDAKHVEKENPDGEEEDDDEEEFEGEGNTFYDQANSDATKHFSVFTLINYTRFGRRRR